jgi:putative ABC transport system permease protein
VNVPKLAWQYLWARPLTTSLNLLLLTLGLAAMAFVLIAQDQLDKAFERDLKGIDAVVGAKGSPMQLILSGVFHIDAPTGNISLDDWKALQAHPQVAQAIPLSMGDNLQGFRIIGTTTDYPAHYGATLAQGQWWTQPMEAVMGAQAARVTGLATGQSFVGAHGLGNGGAVHGDSRYAITGVLAPCACVLDRLVLTATESVWQVHDDMHATDDMDDEDRAAIAADREVTVALIRYKSPLATLSFPRYVNSATDMQAASPALEVARLMSLFSVGAQVLQGLGVVLLGVAGLSVFIALWNAVRERRADLAMLRMLGASPLKVGALLLCESLWLAALACVLGLLAAHGLMALVGAMAMAEQSLAIEGWRWATYETGVPLMAFGVAVMAALVPAVSAYRVDVTHLLNAR